MGDEWHEWLGSLNHGDDCDTTRPERAEPYGTD